MQSYVCPLVGAYYRPPAQIILKCLPSGCALSLAPEPTNPYDPNAVQVLVATAQIPESQYEALETGAGGFGFDLDSILGEPQWHLGYLAKEYAAALVEHILEASAVEATLAFDAKGKPLVNITLS